MKDIPYEVEQNTSALSAFVCITSVFPEVVGIFATGVNRLTPGVLTICFIRHRGKACTVFAPQEGRRIVRRYQKQSYKDICAYVKLIVTFSFPW